MYDKKSIDPLKLGIKVYLLVCKKVFIEVELEYGGVRPVHLPARLFRTRQQALPCF